jgi:hypothetical protein
MKNRQGEEVYGEVDTFVTKNAYVDTLSAENIVEYRAKLRGRAVASEASLISSRGFLYAITPPLINECNPNVMIVGGANTRIPVAGARGFYEYHFPAGGLPAKGRTYCYRSYIELSGKPPTYEYGDMMTFRTLDLAEIKPLAADKIGKVGARVRGEYISSTSPVNRIGFVFSKTEENDNPFLSGEYVTIVNFCVNKTHCEKRMGPPPDGLDIINGGVVYRGIYSLLQPDTGYSFRMFVDNDDGRALTPVRRFRTLK